jgi:type III secretion protein R
MNLTNPVWLIILTAAIALFPILIGLATSYLKMSIVLSMVRNALGTQQVPGSLVSMALALALTFFTMSPVFEESMRLAGSIDFAAVLRKPSVSSLLQLAPIAKPWLEFMVKHTGTREMQALESMSHASNSRNAAREPSRPSGYRVLIPAFMLTELKQAFAMAFVLLLPFLVVDLVVANVLVGMGMYMVSPVMIALPLKLILFVVSDGWLLLARGLIHSYQLS